MFLFLCVSSGSYSNIAKYNYCKYSARIMEDHCNLILQWWLVGDPWPERGVTGEDIPSILKSFPK